MKIVEEFRKALSRGGLHAALKSLNQHASHRFTGVYRYDGDTLRNVALFDRWNPQLEVGEDAPMDQTFCAIVPSRGVALEVVNGPKDERFPWMQANPVVCYCGALLRDEGGQPWGTVCHFDTQPCEAATSHLPELLALAPMVYHSANRTHR
jgi:hypothetical protein